MVTIFDIHLKMLRSAQYQGIVTSMLILYAESLSLVTWYDLIVDFRRKRKCIPWCDVFRTETERLMILFTGESKILINIDEMRIFTESLWMWIFDWKALLVFVDSTCPDHQFLSPITSECVPCNQEEIHGLVKK